jgi:hypothetical protein
MLQTDESIVGRKLMMFSSSGHCVADAGPINQKVVILRLDREHLLAIITITLTRGRSEKPGQYCLGRNLGSKIDLLGRELLRYKLLGSEMFPLLPLPILKSK